MSNVSVKPKVGDLRPSQLLFTFGVGSVVELPNLSVMVITPPAARKDISPIDQPAAVSPDRELKPSWRYLAAIRHGRCGSASGRPTTSAAVSAICCSTTERWRPTRSPPELRRGDGHEPSASLDPQTLALCRSLG